MRAVRARGLAVVALFAVLAAASMLLAPASEAAIGLPGIPLPIPSPLDLGLPDPGDLVGSVFESFFKTFFGLEAGVTQSAVQWLLAAPVYTDPGAYGDLNRLRGSIEVAAWALFVLVFTVSAVRYYVSGFTSAGSYEAVEALGRGAVAAGGLAIYAQVFGSLSIAANSLTYGIVHEPTVSSGLTELLGGATVASFTPLGLGSIAAVAGVVIFVLLIVTKIVLATFLALLYVAAPLGIAVWPLPELAWLGRTIVQSLLGVLLWPVVWALCFALFAVIGASTFAPGGSFGSHIVKPWVSVAALYVAFKAPMLLARQAMLAGLMPSPARAAARGMVYSRVVTRTATSAGATEGATTRAATTAAATAGA